MDNVDASEAQLDLLAAKTSQGPETSSSGVLQRSEGRLSVNLGAQDLN